MVIIMALNQWLSNGDFKAKKTENIPMDLSESKGKTFPLAENNVARKHAGPVATLKK